MALPRRYGVLGVCNKTSRNKSSVAKKLYNLLHKESGSNNGNDYAKQQNNDECNLSESGVAKNLMQEGNDARPSLHILRTQYNRGPVLPNHIE